MTTTPPPQTPYEQRIITADMLLKYHDSGQWILAAKPERIL